MTEKIEAFWSDATAEDVARVINGEIIEARFRDHESVKWVQNGCSLDGWDAGMWASSSGLPWRFCQVYREQSWYANKPDPGEGFRLLGKFPDEELKPGDECFIITGVWHKSFGATISKPQSYGMWYRRRIEPVETTRQVERRVFLHVGDRVRHPSGFLVVVTAKGFEVQP